MFQINDVMATERLKHGILWNPFTDQSDTYVHGQCAYEMRKFLTLPLKSLMARQTIARMNLISKKCIKTFADMFLGMVLCLRANEPQEQYPLKSNCRSYWGTFDRSDCGWKLIDFHAFQNPTKLPSKLKGLGKNPVYSWAQTQRFHFWQPILNLYKRRIYPIFNCIFQYWFWKPGVLYLNPRV